MGTLFFYILQTLVLLDHVYSDCLQNVATNTKNKPFSGFGPWPKMEDMEMIQGKMLRKIYKVPPSTPYWGLLIELGMKPI